MAVILKLYRGEKNVFLKSKIVTSLHPFNINVVSRQLALDRDYCPIRDFLVFQFPDDGHGRLWGGKQVSAIKR